MTSATEAALVGRHKSEAAGKQTAHHVIMEDPIVLASFAIVQIVYRERFQSKPHLFGVSKYDSMYVSRVISAVFHATLARLGISPPSNSTTPCDSFNMSYGNTHTVITDVTVTFCSPGDPACVLDPAKWHRVEKDLLLHSVNQSAWLHIIQEKETELSSNNLVITDVRVGDLPLSDASNNDWERRPGGIWLRRSKYTGNIHQALSGVDVLFGVDAADPRPQWILSRASLQLLALPEVPVARLSVRYGRAEPRLPAPALRAGADGNFKVLQISDTHMVTGVGVCKDAIDASGQPLPESEVRIPSTRTLSTHLEISLPLWRGCSRRPRTHLMPQERGLVLSSRTRRVS